MVPAPGGVVPHVVPKRRKLSVARSIRVLEFPEQRGSLGERVFSGDEFQKVFARSTIQVEILLVLL